MRLAAAALLSLAAITAYSQDAAEIRRRYLDLTHSWADVHFTASEQRAMDEGKKWEELMLKGPDDPLARRILAAGEPSFDALAAMYPGKILDRTLLGTYSDPNHATVYNDEFAIYWNGAIAANLTKTRPVAHNTVVVFRVGQNGEIFGTDRSNFSSMHYLDGYLPIVTGTYKKDGIEYKETAFAAQPEGETGGWDIAFVGFELKNLTASEKAARVAADFLFMDGHATRYDSTNSQPPIFERRVAPGQTARVVFKIPYLPDAKRMAGTATPQSFDAELVRTRDFWTSLLARGAQVQVPEQRVNDVWRALLLQNFILADGDRFTYGSGLAYNDSTYPQENGFAAYVFAMYGHRDYSDALQRNFLSMCVTPQGAGRKYQNRRAMVLHHLLENYRLTGKRDLFDRYRDDYYRVADEIIKDRHSTKGSVAGLLPPDKPGVDLIASTQSVYVLGHNITNCQGLLDFGRFLVTTGIDPERGKHYLQDGADYRRTLMSVMRNAAIRVPGRPPFVDLQTLFFRETPDYGPEPYDDLSLGRVQGTYYHYWVDMSLHYNFFNPRDDVGAWLADYVQQRNGFVLGCTRARTGPDRQYGWINNVYDGGYYDYRLRRGEIDQFLLGLYSRLAFGMSRNLYVSSEGSPFIGYNTQKGGFVAPEDSFPNSASNADTLLMLRNALVYEELEDNVETGTLNLLAGAPKAWLESGKSIQVSRLPTYFGNIAFHIAAADSHTITGEIDAPRGPGCRTMLLHLRRPLKSATVNGRASHDGDLAKGTLAIPANLHHATIKVTF